MASPAASAVPLTKDCTPQVQAALLAAASRPTISLVRAGANHSAETRDRTGDLQIFSLTLSQLSYRGCYELVAV